MIKGKGFIRKCISLLLVLSMCLPMGSTIFADDSVNIVTEYYVNPMYEGLDLDLEFDDGISFYSDGELQTFDSLEEASRYMRDEMVKREGIIEFKVKASYYEGIHKDIYNMAVDENNANNANEGDYIDAHFSGYRVQMSYSSQYVVLKYDINYLTSYEEELLVDKKVNEVLDKLNVYNSSEYVKIKAIHDYIVTNIDYDYSLENHSAYNAIVEESVVCQGFASLTYRMLKELGVGVRYITGYGNGGRHAWNIAKIDDKWYNLDNTWDENISSGTISYKYFLKSMSDFEKHERDFKFTTSEFNSSYPMASQSYTESMDNKPIIIAKNQTIKVGDSFDAEKIATATDREDGDITSKITIKENIVNVNKAGIYKVVYEVVDSDGNKATKEIKVTINNIFINFAVDSVNNKSTTITGKGVSGAKVEAYVDTTKIGSATVDSSGKFSISIKSRATNTKIKVVITKDGYEKAEKTITVAATSTKRTKTKTNDIYKYDAGKGNYLTYINNKGYSQFVYLNKSGNYAFTPSSWMSAAGLSVTMPTSSNGYTMMIDNNYIEMKSKATTLLNNIKNNKISKKDIQKSLNEIENMSTKSSNVASTKATPTKTLTKDIYKYDAGKGKYLTYINGKGYSQYAYLNTSGNYAFTPSSWMSAAGLTVTMPTSSNGYTMKITNQYKLDYEKIIKEIENYM